MTTYHIGVLKGDGIGPEIVSSAVDILDAAAKQHNASIDFIELPIGWSGIHNEGSPIPSRTVNTLKDTEAWLLGPHDSASYPKQFHDLRNPSGELRHYFDLFSNVRPAKNFTGVNSVVHDADLVIYRENTEGFYADRNMHIGRGEFQINEDVALTTGVFTRSAVSRIAHEAFKAAGRRRQKVTIVHKTNVLKFSSGLFLDTCLKVAENYPDIEVDHYHIDAMAAHLIRRIHDFDVIVTENMFGDILSDLTGELVGSLGVAPSINTNNHQAMAQAAHGSAPDIADANTANPMGMVLSAAMLFDWLYNKHDDAVCKRISAAIESAVERTLKDNIFTADMGGKATTTEFTKAVISRLKD